MGSPSHKNEDIEEIFMHIQKLKKQEGQEEQNDTPEPIDIISESTGQVAGELDLENISPDDVFEVIGPVDEVEKTRMQTDDSSVGMCDMCKTAMLFEKNLAGLVIHGKFFACEKCCQDASKADLDSWTQSKNAKPADVKPIAFWLMQKEERTRLIE